MKYLEIGKFTNKSDQRGRSNAWPKDRPQNLHFTLYKEFKVGTRIVVIVLLMLFISWLYRNELCSDSFHSKLSAASALRIGNCADLFLFLDTSNKSSNYSH